MPPKPTLIDTVQLKVTYTGPNSTKATNILYCKMGAGWDPTIANLETLATNFYESWATGDTPVQGVMSEDWSTATFIATDVGGTTENSYELAEASAGTVDQPPLSPNCADTISWLITSHYRGGHPRTYLPGPPTTAVTAAGSNELTSDWRTALAAFAGAFITAFNDALVGEVTEAIGSMAYSRNHEPIEGGPDFYPYQGGTIKGRLDSQRRRLGKESLFP